MSASYNISVSIEILSAMGWNQEKFQLVWSCVCSLFGDKVKFHFSGHINSISQLVKMNFLFKSNEKFSRKSGYAKFIDDLASDPNNGAWATLEFALFIETILGLDVVEFEPETKNGRLSDLIIGIDDELIYVEVKDFNGEDYFYDRRIEIIDLLSTCISGDKQLSVTFNSDIKNSEWKALSREISHRANHLTGTGDIINNSNIKVNIIPKHEEIDNGIRCVIKGFQDDFLSGNRHPFTFVGQQGLRISVAGPLIDADSLVKDKINRAKKQAPYNSPYIIVLRASEFPCSLAQLKDAVQKCLQPDRGKVISGVFLFLGEMKFDAFYGSGFLIRNAFCNWPLPSKIDQHLRSKTIISNIGPSSGNFRA